MTDYIQTFHAYDIYLISNFLVNKLMFQASNVQHVSILDILDIIDGSWQ